MTRGSISLPREFARIWDQLEALNYTIQATDSFYTGTIFSVYQREQTSHKLCLVFSTSVRYYVFILTSPSHIHILDDTMYPPKIVDPKECEVESAETVRCLIGDSHQVRLFQWIQQRIKSNYLRSSTYLLIQIHCLLWRCNSLTQRRKAIMLIRLKVMDGHNSIYSTLRRSSSNCYLLLHPLLSSVTSALSLLLSSF